MRMSGVAATHVNAALMTERRAERMTWRSDANTWVGRLTPTRVGRPLLFRGRVGGFPPPALRAGPLPPLRVPEPVALPGRLQDLTAVGEPVEGGPDQPLAARHLGPLLERQV